MLAAGEGFDAQCSGVFSQIGPNRLADHLYAYFLVALPNLFIHGAILFALVLGLCRLSGSSVQALSLLGVAVKRGLIIVITQTGHVMDRSLNSQIYASGFSLAPMIEVDFLRARTREGLARARSEGRVGGRQKGSVGKLKLDPRLAEIRELYELGGKIPKLAKHFEVNVKTMRLFVRRRFSAQPKSGVTDHASRR